MIALFVDQVRSYLALVVGRGELPVPEARSLDLMRGALHFYRQQRCPGQPTCNVQAFEEPSALLLGRALTVLEALAGMADNSPAQRRLLRYALARVRGVQQLLVRAALDRRALDRRAMQLPVGDRT